MSEVWEEGDPRTEGGMVGHQDFSHINDEVADDDYVIDQQQEEDQGETCVEEKTDLAGSCDVYPMCKTDLDR